ncbi:hypothetical protein CH306_26210 [Rhodococcus sp. 15-725-2-2b]|nr:hypothetical protein CH277_22450 [Rhodococcus sp. 06-469-3-2]OZD40779.1 hypothetical protein CH264_24135 [Rhodococcus sp. 06-1477-1A]OZE67113.1 hypothetical protein CH306_26210 [Rhodococcus sp. 15-725-2-2b]
MQLLVSARYLEIRDRQRGVGMGLSNFQSISEPVYFMQLNIALEGVDAVTFLAAVNRHETGTRSTAISTVVALSAVTGGAAELRAL